MTGSSGGPFATRLRMVGLSHADNSHVVVAWNDDFSTELGFKISDGSTYRTVPANTTSYTWAVFVGWTGCFSVEAYNDGGYSGMAHGCMAWTHEYSAPPNPPRDPYNLTAAMRLSPLRAALSWEDNNGSEDGFRVETTRNGQPTVTTGGAVQGVYHHDVPLVAGSDYCFRVQLFKLIDGASYDSSWSAPACLTTPPLPAAPSGLVVQVVNATTVRLEWTDNSDNETSFTVFRFGPDGAVVSGRAVVASPYEYGGLPTGVQACFAVNAYLSGVGSSSSTGKVCATPS